MARLGIPEEYEAWVVDSATQASLVMLPFKSLKWQRCRNRISEGEVTISADDGGLECCGNFGGLRDWSHMVQIQRDGAIVADGPVVGRRRLKNGDVVVRFQDRFAITAKRIVAVTRVGLQSAGAHFW